MEPSEQPHRPHWRRRKAVNCGECRRSKLRCDRQHPCGACKRRRRESSCSYEVSPVAPGSAGSAQPAAVTGDGVSVEHQDTPTSNDASASLLLSSETIQSPLHTRWESVLERPAPEYDVHDTLSFLSIAPRMSVLEILDSLPPRSCCDYLISHFFKNIFSLFPILHGPTFQKQYTAFFRQPQDVDLSWLALLFSLCSLALNTMDESDPRLLSLWPPQPSSPMRAPATVLTSRHLLRMAMACLLQDGFIFRHKFSTFEALLMVIYCLSHNESVDQGWALLGMALNIGIALRCNIDQNSSPIETERRRRCWAGLLTLHTYQGILFRDVDMSYLLNIKAMLPADVNDSDITDEGISESPGRGEPTQMSVMMAKIRLFRLSTQMCRHISGPSRLDQDALHQWDAAIAEEQKKWDSMYMIDGSPNLLEPTQYAYWCVLQTYAHHLYLLLHRPFHHSRAASFLSTSRERCISSSTALLSIHKQIYEAPLLRNYLWLLSGVTSLKALHAAVALNSCLQDESVTVDPRYNLDSFREEIKSLALRMKALSDRSRICAKGQQILDHFQTQSGVGNAPMTSTRTQLEDLFRDWADIREWIDTDMINWDLDESLN